MKSSYHFLAVPEECGYLPWQVARMEYEHVARMSAAEYADRLLTGWRRFGRMLFRPRCLRCSACTSLRVDVARFAPDRSQRRVARANAGTVQLRIGRPSLTPGKLELYQRFHDYRSRTRGWPWRVEAPEAFHESFVSNPFASEEWRFQLDGRLVGLGYVDALPIGLSAIYFVYEPELTELSLGTWNILSQIAEARARGLDHVYLGYHVAACPSLAYKARFRPYQVLGPDGTWADAPET